jgi:peptide deformylase
MATYALRYLGDPVLAQRAAGVSEIDGRLVAMVKGMFDVLHRASGLALAAPQVGIGKRFFVSEYREAPQVVLNPVIEESSGEWTYVEGCLSVPGLFFEITRPRWVHLTGVDLDGDEVSYEADELQARMFLPEVGVDHESAAHGEPPR